MTPHLPPNPRPARRTVLGLGVAVMALAGCGSKDNLAQQANAGDNKNYIAGDGSVNEYPPGSRGAPVTLEGELFSGEKVTARDWEGKVVVLNFWYAACAPCRVEAPDLAALSAEFKDQGVLFYGVNVRDDAATAAAFERTFNIAYPSFDDSDGSVLLAMTEYVPPRAVPTTLVLDKQGRVSARILGATQKGTLKALITSAAAGT
ncbi:MULTISPECIES: TlpA disulfide reductase family protein [Paenarthrobacter]|uniref:TlpA family protein disulfide reductase n=1 Tax=Paenarthrobacter ureafaciens TaxID=37931 RepID=A0AAX3EPS5_PAEUR|nr:MULTISPECIES: TlpA disulfide reductase family protein [Paenarthrobacter]NKR09902.1 thiol-disulfide isomerase [Arthrobacter sp. M5]NKR16717.1 thiol-disulfide isomerase [Arthrobacter sp. M6]MCW3767317.1 TlpA family protein disulfide reductase [Paenarthrobacter sp. PAE-2]MDO5866891.1 TlpA family protein disulfide reductase [Paenarthrobacter sp. SD-2]MDO5878065.1 TlpA family protein disulfide reductase [Paenarthrobacter sp. SD-1]